MSVTIGGNDPIKGIIAVCELLRKKGLLSQKDWAEIVSQMQTRKTHR